MSRYLKGVGPVPIIILDPPTVTSEACLWVFAELVYSIDCCFWCVLSIGFFVILRLILFNLWLCHFIFISFFLLIFVSLHFYNLKKFQRAFLSSLERVFYNGLVLLFAACRVHRKVLTYSTCLAHISAIFSAIILNNSWEHLWFTIFVW